MQIDLKNTKTVLTGLIGIAYAGMFFPLIISNITLAALLGYCLIHVSLREIVDTVRKNSFSKLCIVIYVLQIIGLTYTTNYSTGFFMLEKKITLLLIPVLLLPMLQKTDLDLKSLLRLIGMITILSSLILLLIAGFNLLVHNDRDAFYFEKVTSIHYVYYSIYFACGSLFLIDVAFDDYGKTKYGFVVVITLFLYALGMLVLIASKTGMMAFGLVSIIVLYKRIRNKKMYALALLLLVFAGTAFCISMKPHAVGSTD